MSVRIYSCPRCGGGEGRAENYVPCPRCGSSYCLRCVNAHAETCTSPSRVVAFVYTNYRGGSPSRRVIPQRLWFGLAEWHPGPQWLLDAWDLAKGERTFAVKDIKDWRPS